MKLYIHDDGSVTCENHAPFSLKAELSANNNPRKRTFWTTRGTWEVANSAYFDLFKQGTGLDLNCETCSPILTREEVNA